VWWLTRDVEIIAQGEQTRRMAAHPLIPAVRKAVGYKTTIEIAEILDTWEIRKTEWGRLSQEVAKALREMGWMSRRQLRGGIRSVRWFAPEQEPY
jgi:hypothetical protein